MTDLLFIQVGGIAVGITLILTAARYKKGGVASLWQDKPWSRSGFNPLYPFGLKKNRELWTSKGFRLHILGLVLFLVGVISGAVTAIIDMVRR